VYSTEQAHNGNRSVRAGIAKPGDNVFSYSSAIQTVQIPTGTQTTTLAFWWYPLSTEGALPQAASAVDDATVQAIADGVAPATPLAGDRQYALLLNEQNSVLARLFFTRSNGQSWQHATFDLRAYAGKTVRILFGAYNDGANGVTALYVDEATLLTCQAQAAASYLPLIQKLEVTPTPTLIATAPPTATPAPEGTLVWPTPTQAIELFSPVKDGLYHSPIEVNGFSQTFEGNVNLRLTDKNGQVLAERNVLGGSVDSFDFFASYLRFTVSEQISATLDVFETSAMDGSEIHKVQIPLVLLPGQRVIDLNRPAVGETVCQPVLMAGYSNTFEATLGVNLSQWDGTELTRTIAMGGNLGVYADFTTTISQTVTAPTPRLVGAFEDSPAGFGRVDYTRVPVALYPAGTGACP
ncbi:MAG: hypothetical protein NT075_21960, partial [Chloroflexi bacterium]|nr:hypothetical protein [Chloroflexota bacterium]